MHPSSWKFLAMFLKFSDEYDHELLTSLYVNELMIVVLVSLMGGSNYLAF